MPFYDEEDLELGPEACGVVPPIFDYTCELLLAYAVPLTNAGGTIAVSGYEESDCLYNPPFCQIQDNSRAHPRCRLAVRFSISRLGLVTPQTDSLI